MLASSASAGTTRHGISFSNVVKATDFGADPTGSSPSDAAVKDAVSEGTLVVFPPGEYRFEDGMSWTGLSTFGFYGDGDVRFRPPDGHNNLLVYVVADRFLFEGIDIDLRAPNTNAGFGLKLRDRFVVSDVTQLGRGNHSDWNVQNAFGCRALEPDAVGILQNVVIKQGSSLGDYNGGNGRVAVFAGKKHEGTLKIRNCHFEEFGNNAIYCSKTPGDVHVENCFLRNNNIASVRLGGAGSYVKDTVVEMDMDKYTGPTDGLGSKFNMRGIWLEHLNRTFDGGAAIDGCTISVANTDAVSSAIIINSEVGAVPIRNTTIRVDADDTAGIVRKYPDDGKGPVTLDNVSVVGSGTNDDGILILGTEGTRVRNSCVYLPGSERVGVRVKEATDCVIRDTNVAAGGERIVVQSADVTRYNNTSDASCPLPGTKSGDADHRIVVESVGSKDWTKYSFETTGGIEKGGSADGGDTVSGTTVEGGVGGGGTDAFGFDGELVEFKVLTGDAENLAVFVDGSKVDVTSRRRLEVRSVGPENWVKYTVETTGDVVKEGGADTTDTVSGTTIEGSVSGGRFDGYSFDGEVTDFSVVGGDRGSVAVYVDGQQLDLNTDSTLEVRSVGAEGWVKYAFEASGDVDSGKWADSGDDVTGSSATGGIGGGGTDTYRFAGELQQFVVLAGSLDDVAISVDGSPVDFTNEIRIEGTGDYVGYEFEATGSVKAADLADGSDTVDGSVASGGVTAPGVDSYQFSGDIERFDITGGSGDVEVYVNGEPYSI
jgi:hypothetical protein